MLSRVPFASPPPLQPRFLLTLCLIAPPPLPPDAWLHEGRRRRRGGVRYVFPVLEQQENVIGNALMKYLCKVIICGEGKAGEG